jgi:hypothetical protein
MFNTRRSFYLWMLGFAVWLGLVGLTVYQPTPVTAASQAPAVEAAAQNFSPAEQSESIACDSPSARTICGDGSCSPSDSLTACEGRGGLARYIGQPPDEIIVVCEDLRAVTRCADGTCSTSSSLAACQGRGGIYGLNEIMLAAEREAQNLDADSRSAVTGISNFRLTDDNLALPTAPSQPSQSVSASSNPAPAPASQTSVSAAAEPIVMLPVSGSFGFNPANPQTRLFGSLSLLMLGLLLAGAGRAWWQEKQRR